MALRGPPETELNQIHSLYVASPVHFAHDIPWFLVWEVDLACSLAWKTRQLLGKMGLPLPSSSSITHHPSKSFQQGFLRGQSYCHPGTERELRGYRTSSS